jgi:hypothetical protein
VDDLEPILRRLAINDEESVGSVLARDPGALAEAALCPKIDLLAHLESLWSSVRDDKSVRVIVRPRDRELTTSARSSVLSGL